MPLVERIFWLNLLLAWSLITKIPFAFVNRFWEKNQGFVSIINITVTLITFVIFYLNIVSISNMSGGKYQILYMVSNVWSGGKTKRSLHGNPFSLDWPWQSRTQRGSVVRHLCFLLQLGWLYRQLGLTYHIQDTLTSERIMNRNQEVNLPMGRWLKQ